MCTNTLEVSGEHVKRCDASTHPAHPCTHLSAFKCIREATHLQHCSYVIQFELCLRAMCAFVGGSSDTTTHHNDALRKEILICFWPVEELPTTFSYAGKDFTYDPAAYDGPVMVFLAGKEAVTASREVSSYHFTFPPRCLAYLDCN